MLVEIFPCWKQGTTKTQGRLIRPKSLFGPGSTGSPRAIASGSGPKNIRKLYRILSAAILTGPASQHLFRATGNPLTNYMPYTHSPFNMCFKYSSKLPDASEINAQERLDQRLNNSRINESEKLFQMAFSKKIISLINMGLTKRNQYLK